MALLTIHTYPDSCLRNLAGEVDKFDASLETLVNNMAETMYDAPGIGLAGPQVNINQRVVVIDVSEEKDDLLVLINPQLANPQGSQEYEEGCLSIPGVFGMVERAAEIDVSALDVTGKPIEFRADGLLAVCVQHEVDHLNGKLFIDHLSRLKRERIIKKIQKEARQGD